MMEKKMKTTIMGYAEIRVILVLYWDCPAAVFESLRRPLPQILKNKYSLNSIRGAI